MTDLTNLHAAVTAMCNANANQQGILTLGGLRAALKVLPPDMPVVMPDDRSPGAIKSYRGYYERLAIDGSGDATTAADLIAALNAADGETFQGYKGGDFYMDSGTFMHAAEYGDLGDQIVGVRIDGDRAVIETAEEVW